MNMKKTRKLFTVLMALVMVMTIIRPVTADAAAKPKLNKTKVTLTITAKKKNPAVKLKAKNAKGKVKWSTSNKKVATVKNGKVAAKSAGKATITCKVNKKKLTCKVTVKDKRTNKNNAKGELKVEIKHSENMALPYFKGIEFADNRVVVACNGKDVTKKADYELIGNDTTYCLIDGIITESRKIGTYLDGNYTLKVEYQGIEKRVKIKIVTEKSYYYECYCGTQFYDEKELCDHMKRNALDAAENGTYGTTYKCGGNYDIPCCITKVTVVQ